MSANLNILFQTITQRIVTLEKIVNRLNTRDGGRNIKNLPLTIGGGTITVSRQYHAVSAETGTSDDLTSIAATGDGITVILRAAIGHTITVIDGSNLALTGNCVLNGSSTLSLIYDKELALWLEVTRS